MKNLKINHKPAEIIIEFYVDHTEHLNWKVYSSDYYDYPNPYRIYIDIANHYLNFIDSLNVNKIREYLTKVFKEFNIELKRCDIKFNKWSSKYRFTKALKDHKQFCKLYPSKELQCLDTKN